MTMFRAVGPYEIVRQIGRGMNPVFLATDTRSGAVVALKVIPIGSDDEAREVLEAERQGADLQRRFSELTEYVPRVYESGLASDYFYIAMEYIEGDDLAAVIARGPLAPERAAAIAVQLCRFLEEVDRVAGAGGESALTLLHNDLKPGNIRLEPGDRVKVLDFGAAKVLSLSRRVTRNVFGSIPYLSPECLETGRRDRHSDAWALGVLLYEMVAGRPPFRADTTVNLERRIRSRQPPERPAGVPDGLQRVMARLLAPDPAARYPEPAAIRRDLERVLAGEQPAAAALDAFADEAATRRTSVPDDEPPTRRVTSAPDEAPAIDMPADTVPTRRLRRRGKFRRVAAVLILGLIVFMLGNEAAIARRAGQLAGRVPLQEYDGLIEVWGEYFGMARRSYLGFGLRELEDAIVQQSETLAFRVIDNYRSPSPTVRERQWMAAVSVLERAVQIEPRNGRLRAALRYSQGHILRINGEADKGRGQLDNARRKLNDAVSAFREATTLRPGWPDPFLGLARTFIYGLEDVDRGADAINEAQRLGFRIGEREIAQLGDGYRARGETLERAADELDGLPQKRESLTRAAEAFRQALAQYSKIADYGDVPERIRTTQQRLASVEEELRDTAGPFNRLLDAITGAF